MKRIVFINQATGYLTIDIVNSFAKHFDEIVLIAGSIRVQDIKLDSKVKWQKIALYNRGTPIKKILSWILGSVQIFFLLIFKFRRFEIFYFTIPPFAYLSSIFLKRKFSILVYDVYPDVLSVFGIGPNNIIYKIWNNANKRIFRKAHRVFTISEGMAKALENYVNKEKIHLIPLWSGLTNIKPIPKEDNKWLKDFGFKDKFIVQYSGNIGYTHKVEVLIELAERMIADESFHFLIIGRGERYNAIADMIAVKNLSNCSLMEFQPDEVLNSSLAAADLSVVIQDDKVANGSLPSKIFNIQAVGIPVLGISTLDSSLKHHLDFYAIGKCFTKNNIMGMIEFIYELRNNNEKYTQLKNNSFMAASKFSIENAKLYYSIYESHLS